MILNREMRIRHSLFATWERQRNFFEIPLRKKACSGNRNDFRGVGGWRWKVVCGFEKKERLANEISSKFRYEKRPRSGNRNDFRGVGGARVPE
jgi:hypothetical protein